MTSRYLTHPIRSLADAAADRHGCLRRWPVACMEPSGDGDVEHSTCDGWGQTPTGAVADARRRWKGYRIRVRETVDGDWNAVRLSDGQILSRAEFIAGILTGD